MDMESVDQQSKVSEKQEVHDASQSRKEPGPLRLEQNFLNDRNSIMNRNHKVKDFEDPEIQFLTEFEPFTGYHSTLPNAIESGAEVSFSGKEIANKNDMGKVLLSRHSNLVPILPKHRIGGILTPSMLGYDLEILESRPWRDEPHTEEDFFNYGFDEESWFWYVQKHSYGPQSVLQLARRRIAQEHELRSHYRGPFSTAKNTQPPHSGSTRQNSRPTFSPI